MPLFLDMLISFCTGIMLGYFFALWAIHKISVREVVKQAENMTRKAIEQ